MRRKENSNCVLNAVVSVPDKKKGSGCIWELPLDLEGYIKKGTHHVFYKDEISRFVSNATVHNIVNTIKMAVKKCACENECCKDSCKCGATCVKNCVGGKKCKCDHNPGSSPCKSCGENCRCGTTCVCEKSKCSCEKC